MSLIIFLIGNAAGIGLGSYLSDRSLDEIALSVIFSTGGALNYALYLYMSRSHK